MIDKTRELALKILYKIDKENAYSNIALNEMLNQNKKELTNKDIGLISEIVYGTTTWKLTLDEIIKKYSKIKLKKISTWILNILRMGIYQIIFLDKIPKSAAVNESVNLSKRYGHKSSSNFVNAILRKVTRKDYEDFYKKKDDIQRISFTNSMPMWIIPMRLPLSGPGWKSWRPRAVKAARQSTPMFRDTLWIMWMAMRGSLPRKLSLP